MKAITKVLAATDLSDPADEALRQAHETAERAGAELGVCHAVPVEIFAHPLFPHFLRDEAMGVPAAKSRAADALAERVRRVTGRLESQFRSFVEDGPAATAIVRVGETWNADRIVVGSHGESGLHRATGRVALSVVRHAHGPVLVARPGPGTGNVVAGTDFSDPALPAVTAAAEEALWRGGALTLVHAVEEPALTLGPQDLGATAFGETIAKARVALETAAREHLAAALSTAGVEGRSVVTFGPASAVVLRTAEEMGADLVVVGTVGRTGLSRMLLGSVAEAIIRAAHCSVLAVRLHPR